MVHIDLRQDGLLLFRDTSLLLGVAVAKEDADCPDMDQDELRPGGLLLGRDPDLLLGAVVVKEDADRPEMVEDDLRPGRPPAWPRPGPPPQGGGGRGGC